MSLVLQRLATVVMLVAVFAVSAPESVSAFELFGFKFFESDDSGDTEVLDAISYSATLVVDSDDRALSEKLTDGSLLVRKQNQPPSGTIGLIARARDDLANLMSLLYEEAYYGATVSIIIAGRPFEQIGVNDKLGSFAGKARGR